MQITVQGYLTLSQKLGQRVCQLPDQPPPTLQDLLDYLAADLGLDLSNLGLDSQTGRSKRTLVLLLNGQHLSHLPAGLQTMLQEGDQLAIFPPIAGG